MSGPVSPKSRYEMNCESQSECTSWKRLFRAFDKDHDGFIPAAELKRVVRDSTYSFGMNPEQVDAMLHGIDMNKDNMIDFAEFCTLLSRAKRLHLRHVIFRAAQMVVPKGKRAEHFDYLQKYKCCPPPLFMLLISILQVAAYVYYVVQSGEGVHVSKPVPVKSPLIFDPHRLEEVWRFFTYAFVHIGIYHVVFNVLTQLILGIPLELVHQWRTILVYIGGIISGSLLVAAVDPRVYLAGASGGVYALLAAHLAELIMNWGEMEFAPVRAFILFILIASDAGVAVYQRYFLSGEINKISYVSHIGGFVAGVLLGIVLLRNFRKHKWEARVWWAALVAYILFTIVCIILIVAPKVF
ncbi:hypothetical protein PENTCL1PPCAC_10435 [Pristionchus entomophagus]|uniref:rhomboid protease n=1 Tax=Pristionchus entomophagus TaxID=358040 RepID=A0AAV5T7J1_9BILA|nr:hypothetical protein PENTCL1PPCAC_10435 [Pristionchus entomophagus]